MAAAIALVAVLGPTPTGGFGGGFATKSMAHCQISGAMSMPAAASAAMILASVQLPAVPVSITE